MHAASKITPEGVAHEDRRSSLHFYTLFSKLAFSPAWDGFFLLNVALAELRSRRLTQSDGMCKRLPLRQEWKSLESGLIPVPTLEEHITKHRLCLSSKLSKKTVVQSHVRPRKCLQKVQKAMLLAWSNSRDAPNLGPGRNNTIGLFVWFLVRCPRRVNWLILLIRFILYVDTFAIISRRIKKPTSIQLWRYRNRWWVCQPCNGNWKLWQVDWDKQRWWVSLGASQMLWLTS